MNIVKLKKAILLVMIMLVCCLLVACNSDSQSYSGVKDTFTGTVELVSKSGGITVHVEEPNDLPNIIDVGMPDDINEEFNVGDKVKIGYDGTTFERSPVKVLAITVEKIK